VDGLIQNMNGDVEASTREYLLALQFDSSSNSIYASLADNYIQMGRLDKGLAVVQKILARDANHIDALESLSEIYIQQHEFEKAVTTLEKITKIDPSEVDAHYRLITIYEVQGKNSEAAAHYKVLLDLLGPNTLLSLKLADLYMKNRAYDKAVEALIYARGSDPNNVFVLDGLAQAYTFNKEFPKAVETYETLSELQENDYLVFVRIGSLCIQTGNYDKALASFQRAEQLGAPNSGDIQRSIGFALNQLKRDREAVIYYEKAILSNPKDIISMSLLAPIYQAMNRTDRSDSIFETILALDPENDLILNNYSYSLAERGIKLDKALTMIQKAMKKSPNNSHYLDTIGWIYFQLNQYEVALKYVRQSFQLNDASWEVADHLGDIHARLKKFSEARNFWEKALKINGDNETIMKKINELPK
jgi:tetratricopeptide (TPR) repeat protein